MKFSNLKSVQRHVANLRRKGLVFPFSLTMLVKLILEIIRYDATKLVSTWLHDATTVPFDEDRPVTSFFTRFGLFSAFRVENNYQGFLPVTSRDELERTGKYATLWGINWFVNRDMPEDEIWVISDITKGSEVVDHKVYKFRIQDNDNLEQVP